MCLEKVLSLCEATKDSVIELGGDTRGDGSQSRSGDPSQVAGGPPTSTISGATFTLNGHWQEGVGPQQVRCYAVRPGACCGWCSNFNALSSPSGR